MVIGTDAGTVGKEVRRRREHGDRIAGFVGHDQETARAMGDEMLGGCDEVVVLGAPADGRPESEPEI